ncbi:hypothetical protein [Scytonema sp. PCC 10023]|uniref:hypothetical protein n=1 Tax=Scytonema sp. PCC 10023 TaxID=1680591 RepID=UPI0039C719F9
MRSLFRAIALFLDHLFGLVVVNYHNSTETVSSTLKGAVMTLESVLMRVAYREYNW